MTLNQPLLYFAWTEEYCHTSPNKNKAPNLWHVTSILVCCIFVCNRFFESDYKDLKSSFLLSSIETKLTQNPDKKTNSLTEFIPKKSSWKKILPKKSSQKISPKKFLQKKSPQKIILKNSPKIQKFFKIFLKIFLKKSISLHRTWRLKTISGLLS